MGPKLSCPQFPSIALDSPKVVISLPWVALSLVTILVTVALDCPRLPRRLVTELVTSLPGVFGHNQCKLAVMQAPVWYLASVLSSRSRLRRLEVSGACVQKTTASSSRPERLFNSGHGNEQPVGMIKQRHKLVVQVEGTCSVIQCVDDYTD